MIRRKGFIVSVLPRPECPTVDPDIYQGCAAETRARHGASRIVGRKVAPQHRSAAGVKKGVKKGVGILSQNPHPLWVGLSSFALQKKTGK